MEEQDEGYIHTIIIDPYITIAWKIPKVITPIELKAMSSKVNKLFNLSEVQIIEQSTSTAKRKYGGHWTDALKEKTKELYGKGTKPKEIAKAIYEMSGDTYFSNTSGVHSQLNYLKRKGFLNGKKTVTPRRTRNIMGINKRFSAEDIAEIISIWGSGKKTSVEVRDALNEKMSKSYSKKQITDKLYQLKVKGMIK